MNFQHESVATCKMKNGKMNFYPDDKKRPIEQDNR